MALDFKGIADYASSALGGIESLLALGKEVSDIIGFVTTTKERIDAMAHQQRGPTQEEWNAQKEMIDQLRGDLHSDQH